MHRCLRGLCGLGTALSGSPGRSRAAIAGSVFVRGRPFWRQIHLTIGALGNGPGVSSAQLPQVRRDSDRLAARTPDHVDVGVTKPESTE